MRAEGEGEEQVSGGGSDEMMAELRELERMADEDPAVLDQAAAVEAQAAEESAARGNLADEIAGALLMLSKVAAPMFPTLAKVYTQESCAAVGAAIAPVCDKYGWMQGGMGEYGEEIMCLIVVGPMAYATYSAVSVDLEARAERERAEKGGKSIGVGKAQPVPGAMSVPGSDTVTIGAPVA